MNDIMSSVPHTAAARRVSIALQQVGRSIELTKNYAAKQLGLHPSDLACIGFIYSAGQPVSPKQIIAYLEVTSGTGTALLDRLEAASFIKRVPNPDDRRSVLIVLDEEKAAGPISFYKLLRSQYMRTLSGRSEEELVLLATMLEQFSAVDIEHELKALEG